MHIKCRSLAYHCQPSPCAVQWIDVPRERLQSVCPIGDWARAWNTTHSHLPGTSAFFQQVQQATVVIRAENETVFVAWRVHLLFETNVKSFESSIAPTQDNKLDQELQYFLKFRGDLNLLTWHIVTLPNRKTRLQTFRNIHVSKLNEN